MNVVVCIKQVPDTTEMTIDKETKTLNRETAPAIMNPFDVYAIEEALQIATKLGGNVTAITMGPKRAKEIIYEAFSMGVENGVLISDLAFMGSDTYCTAKTLSTAIRKLSDVDLIICGKQAIDGDTAQVGPGIAEMLNIPHVPYVRKVLEINNKKITLESEMDNGYQIAEMEFPGLITVLKGINVPRHPSLRLLRKGKARQRIQVWDIQDLGLKFEEVGLKGSPTTVESTYIPKIESNAIILRGSPEEKAQEMLKKLHNKLDILGR